MKQLSLILIFMILSIAGFATPGPISGPTATCVGVATVYTDASVGGTWSSSVVAVATISSTTGILTGVAAGVTDITYNVSGSYVTYSVTVNPAPTAITGPSSVCVGSTITETDGTSGGVWSVSSITIATVSAATGVVTGVSAGTTMLTYTAATGCSTDKTLTVTAGAGAISGASSICVGGTETVSAAGGGTWSSTSTAVASVGMTTGVITANAAGVCTILYTIGSGCTSSMALSVNPLPAVYTISGGGSYCAGGTGADIMLSGSQTGVSYQLFCSGTAMGGVVAGTGASIDFGMFTIAGTYTIMATTTSGCTSNMTGSGTITINPLPTVYSVTGSSACGGEDVGLSNSDFGIVYQLYNGTTAVGTAVSGSGSVISFGLETSGGTYTVVATNTVTGCTSNMTGSAIVTSNRINGNIIYSGGTSTDTFKVWLIQYSSVDSSLTGLDSTYTCMESGTPYFEFDGMAAGNYLVKAKMNGTVAGTSGYIPTYGLSNTHWDTATTIVHGTGTDAQNIDMIYGTVPTGPGFIGGLIVSGAGRATSGDIPAVGMLVYLKNATTGAILTYTYTDATGAYSFSSLANGNYIIDPQDYKYYTTPSAVITLSASAESFTGVNFKQHTTLGTITPYLTPTVIHGTSSATNITLFPNPAAATLNMGWNNQAAGTATLTITDLLGRTVLTSYININAASGQTSIDLSSINNGLYMISVTGDNIASNGKLLIQH